MTKGQNDQKTKRQKKIWFCDVRAANVHLNAWMSVLEIIYSDCFGVQQNNYFITVSISKCNWFASREVWNMKSCEKENLCLPKIVQQTDVTAAFCSLSPWRIRRIKTWIHDIAQRNIYLCAKITSLVMNCLLNKSTKELNTWILLTNLKKEEQTGDIWMCWREKNNKRDNLEHLSKWHHNKWEKSVKVWQNICWRGRIIFVSMLQLPLLLK